MSIIRCFKQKIKRSELRRESNIDIYIIIYRYCVQRHLYVINIIERNLCECNYLKIVVMAVNLIFKILYYQLYCVFFLIKKQKRIFRLLNLYKYNFEYIFSQIIYNNCKIILKINLEKFNSCYSYYIYIYLHNLCFIQNTFYKIESGLYQFSRQSISNFCRF